MQAAKGAMRMSRVAKPNAELRQVFHVQRRAFSVADTVVPSDSGVPRAAGRHGTSGIVATVFGASGFLGRFVVSRLGRIGSQCIIPYRGDGTNCRHLKPMGDLGQIIPLPVKLGDMASLNETVKRSNVVINLIGNARETWNYSYRDTHVKCAFQVAKAAKEAGVDRFIHVSALGAHKDAHCEFLKSKAEGEEAVKLFYPDATIMRPAPIFGEEDNFINRVADMVRCLPVVPTVEGGTAKMQPVFATDVANAIMNAVGDTRSVGQTYDLGGGEVLDMNELLELVYQHTYKKGSSLSLPVELAEFYGLLVEQMPKRWAPITRDTVRQFSQDQVCVNGNDLQKLGVMNPVAVSARIARILILHRGERGPAPYSNYQ